MTNRIYAPVICASIIAMLLLMGLRLYYGVSFSEPLQYITSGDEQASMFAIWKATKGLEVYSDPTQSPYSMSFYNALFYSAYGVWTSFWLDVLSLDDAWLPTVARSLTLIGVVIGAIITLYMLRTTAQRVLTEPGQFIQLLVLNGAFILFIGPLMGFWAFTVRPDIWAYTFEALGVLIFVLAYGRNRNLAVTLTAVAFVFAWFFKQATIGAVCGVGLFLLFERNWRTLFLFCGVYLGLCLMIILAGDDLYRQSLFFTQIKLEYSLNHGIKVWMNALSKTLPIYLPLAVFLYGLIKFPEYRHYFFSHWVCRFFLAGLIAVVSIIFVLTLQDASAENYTFAPNLFAAGLMVCALCCMTFGKELRKNFERSYIGATIVHIALCLLVISGSLGVLDAAKKTHPSWMNAAQCINQFEKPIFAESTYLSLPWMVESTEHFVLSYTYDRARDLGLPHEKGGIGGRITNGEFATLALSTNTRENAFDGADLQHYSLTSTTCKDLHIWSRADSK